MFLYMSKGGWDTQRELLEASGCDRALTVPQLAPSPLVTSLPL